VELSSHESSGSQPRSCEACRSESPDGCASRNFGIALGFLTALAMIITSELGFGTYTYRAYQKPQLNLRLALAGIAREMISGLVGVL
jgi:hypothetical protein